MAPTRKETANEIVTERKDTKTQEVAEKLWCGKAAGGMM